MEEVVRYDSLGFKELRETLERSCGKLEGITEAVKKHIVDERYLTTGEMTSKYKMSKRTLQNHRDERVIPYTSIGGKILYPVSGIREILDANYVPRVEY